MPVIYDDTVVTYDDIVTTYDGGVFGSLVVLIEDVDRSAQIDWRSLSITEAITKEPDTCDFRILNYPTKTYAPSEGDLILVYINGFEVFGGVVVATEESIDGMLKYTNVKCNDYAQLLDRKVANETYTNQTATAIVQDLISTYATDFTTANVDAPVIIPVIEFNYLHISQCLTQIAAQLGDYDWYIDFDKDIHFFEKESRVAPFDLDDTNGNFIWNSLVIVNNITQLRNHIFVIGNNGAIVEEVIDSASVTAYGTYQYPVIDASITDADAATQRGQAELNKYASPSKTIKFRTYTDGLHAGQYITLDSTIRGITQVYQINRLTAKMHTSMDRLDYSIEGITSENIVLNDVLKKLLLVDPSHTIS